MYARSAQNCEANPWAEKAFQKDLWAVRVWKTDSTVWVQFVVRSLKWKSICSLKRHATKKPNIIVYDTQGIAALFFNGSHHSHFYDRSLSCHEVLRIHSAIVLLQNYNVLVICGPWWTQKRTRTQSAWRCESLLRSLLSNLPIFLLSQVPRRLPWPNTAHNETLWQNCWISDWREQTTPGCTCFCFRVYYT